MKRSEIVELDVVARKMENTLKTVSRASISATRLRTGAIYGSLGFGVGAGGTFAVLATASMLVYAPFAVPLLGMCGLLAGILVSRDEIDRTNERSVDLVEQAWTLRDREVGGLVRQIELARHEQSPRLQLLEQKLTSLQLAHPEQLMDYYGLHDHKIRQRQNKRPVFTLGPAEQQVLEAWKSPVGELPKLRDASET